MSTEVRGRVILITGAGSGIGEALASRFREDGALVADWPGLRQSKMATGTTSTL